MSKIVQRRTNTGTGQYWMRRLMRTAGGLAKFASWRGVKDGYLLLAKRTGKQRSATMLDLPPRVRVLAVLAGIPGPRATSPAIKAAGSRDGFHPTADANLSLTGADNQENPDRATLLQYVVGAPLPDSAIIALRSTSVIPAPTTPVDNYAVTSTYVDHVGESFMYYPMEDTTTLWEGTNHFGKADEGVVSLALSESVVKQLLGAVFFPRGLSPGFNDQEYPVTYPRPVGQLVGNLQVTVAPVVIQTAVNKAEDYGVLSLFFAFNQLSEQGGSSQFYSVTLPSVPALTQGEWSDTGDGALPHYYQANMVVEPDGAVTLYGSFFFHRYSVGSNSSTPDQYVSTQFRLRLDADKGQTWNILACDVTGDDTQTGLGGTRVNSANGVVRIPSTAPAVFYGGGYSWGFYVQYNLAPFSSLFNKLGQGIVNSPDSTDMRVARGANTIDVGLPAGATFQRNLPTEVTIVPLATRVSRRQAFVCCHVDSGGVFGVTFPVFSEADGSILLAKWDTVGGFSYWEGCDLTEVNVASADFLPSVTCYQKCSVVRGEVVGFPGLMMTGAFDGFAKTYTINSNRAKQVATAGGLGAILLGNKLQTTPLDSLYRR